MKQKYSYLIHLRFLGYRFHGWIKQPNVKTIQEAIEKVLRYVLGHEDFKTLGCARTDAKVSANHYVVQLFLDSHLDEGSFLSVFNENLPHEIQVLKIESVESNFNIIKAVTVKEYLYLFSFGEKAHPYAASIMANFSGALDIDLMKEGAKLFEGFHDFKNYCKGSSEEIEFKREILLSEIRDNTIYTANFFPKKSYTYHVHSKGFMRHQVRLMMGQLVLLGRGAVTLEDIKNSLKSDTDSPVSYLAPAPGLHLNAVKLKT